MDRSLAAWVFRCYLSDMKRRRPTLASIARRFDLALIVRFGSRASDRATPGSDLDIAVLPSRHERMGLLREASLVVALEEALGEGDVDLAVLHGDDGLLLYEVARTGQPLYESAPGAFLNFSSYASRRFQDTEKFRSAACAWLEARLA